MIPNRETNPLSFLMELVSVKKIHVNEKLFNIGDRYCVLIEFQYKQLVDTL